MTRVDLGMCQLELADRSAGEASLRAATRGRPETLGRAINSLASASHGRFFFRLDRHALRHRRALWQHAAEVDVVPMRRKVHLVVVGAVAIDNAGQRFTVFSSRLLMALKAWAGPRLEPAGNALRGRNRRRDQTLEFRRTAERQGDRMLFRFFGLVGNAPAVAPSTMRERQNAAY